MSARQVLAAGGLGVLLGAALTLVVTGRGPAGDAAGRAARAVAAAERSADLGPDDARIGGLRLTLRTGAVNGAGTDNHVLVWFDNRRYELADDPAGAFAAGGEISATLRGPGVPRTLGELRRASIVLTLDLGRAEMAASWYCDEAVIDVRLEGEETYAPYLVARDVGWLSQDEPPRRSTAYALQ